MPEQPQDQSAPLRKRVHRPTSSATWEHAHRWGHQIGDVTNLRVTRVDGGSLRIAYGKDSVEVREELVGHLARMITAASEWTDKPGGGDSDG